jgi:tetrahydromethanopterin S-methyltransferase subunit E
MNILVSGSIRVTTDEGVQTLTGPMVFNSKAGSKKAGYAITDVVFLNVHPTNLTDVDEIEKEVIAPSFEALENLICHG